MSVATALANGLKNWGAISLVEPLILPPLGYHARGGKSNPAQPVTKPLPTITAGRGGDIGLVQPHLIDYHGNGKAHSVNEPVPVLTAKDRIGLVQPVVDGVTLDILFRMLQPHELWQAMGFPPDYEFTGKREDVIRQIGNAVEVNISKALCLSMLNGHATHIEDFAGAVLGGAAAVGATDV